MNLKEIQKDEAQYAAWQDQQHAQWEALCQCCGACCGVVDGDPCEHLIELADHKYACRIYDDRFGEHKTRAERVFRCVPIREILHKPWPGDHACAYKQDQA